MKKLFLWPWLVVLLSVPVRAADWVEFEPARYKSSSVVALARNPFQSGPGFVESEPAGRVDPLRREMSAKLRAGLRGLVRGAGVECLLWGQQVLRPGQSLRVEQGGRMHRVRVRAIEEGCVRFQLESEEGAAPAELVLRLERAGGER
jgi:hypothetical protein